jgi:hypothetical protein
MSAVASFYLLDIFKLDELNRNAEVVVRKTLFSKKITDHYGDFLANNATELPGFDGSGYIYGNLLVFLEEEKSIDLTQNEHDDMPKTLLTKEVVVRISCLQINKKMTLSANLIRPNTL